MMRKYPFVVGAIAAVSIAGSLLLIPRGQEKALMHLKDKQFTQAQQAYEKQAAKGELNAEVASQLARLYLQNGEVDQAIGVMEKFISAHPGNVEALKELGTLYQYAQRTDDYIRNLEAINRIRPDRETLERLADVYSFNAQYEKNLETLKQLVQLGPEASAKYYLALAQIQATQNQRADAIKTLVSLRHMHPDSFTFEETRLLVSLLLDENRQQEAFQASAEWRNRTKQLAEVAALANLLHFKGSAELALRLLEPYEDVIGQHPEILKEYTVLLMDTGKMDDAFQRLYTLYQKGSLPTELNQHLLILASAKGDEKLLGELVTKIDLRSLTEIDAANLAELAMIRRDEALLKKFHEAFPQDKPNDKFPLLMAMLAVDAKSSFADARLKALEGRELSNPQLLMLARTCARAGNKVCVRTTIARLRDPQSMTDSEVASLAELYMMTGLINEGAAFINEMAEKRSSKEINAVRVRFAAAQGKADVVIAWVDANKQNATVHVLRDLYFIAMNNKQYALAVSLAERLYALDASTEHRSFLAYVYLKSGQFEQGVNLLRGAADRSDEDERNYLSSLVELAAVQPERRKELTDYANAHLSGTPSDKQKLGILYALARGRQLEDALPALKEFAEKRGGTWSADYATVMMKRGNPELARRYWLRTAYQPSTSTMARVRLAYNLLNAGYKDDAQALFFDLAKNGKPGSDEVNRVLYLWGPRPTADQLDWLYTRLRAAPLAEKPGWGRTLLAYASSETLDTLVGRHPEILNNPIVARRYFITLQTRGQLEPSLDVAINASKATGNTEMLRQYGRTAQDYMLRRASREAYMALLQAIPDDPEGLATVGFATFGQADYSESEKHLSDYLYLDPSLQQNDKTWRAFFYYGEIMRREGRDEEARYFYEKAIEEIRLLKLDTADALSGEAQSMVWTGQVEDGLEHFPIAMARYPDDEVLRLDYIATLLALKRYDEAREMLATQPRLTPPIGTAGPALPLPVKGLKGYQMSGYGSEVVLYFHPSKQGRAAFPEGTDKKYEWVSYISDSYDQTLIAAKPGHVMELVRDNNNTLLLVARPVTDAGAEEVRRQIYLRHQLLTARLELETGHEDESLERLARLSQEFPDDTQLMGYRANALNYTGNWQKAVKLLERARELAPENEDLALLHDDIRFVHSPEIKLDYEYQKRGRDKLHIMTLNGYYIFDDGWEAGGNIQNVRLQTKAKQRADGRFGNFKGERQRGELYIAKQLEEGDRAKLSVYANNDTAGLGLYYDWRNDWGTTEFAAEWHRPYWEFVEGILDDATRDRLGIRHTHQINPRLAITGNASLNRYHVADISNVASTYGFGGGIYYTLVEMDRRDRLQMVLGYGLDAEYGFSRKGRYTTAGTFYRPFPFRNREIHVISLQTVYMFTDVTRGDLILGYGFDRHGGHGPGIEGRLTHSFTDDWEGQVRAAYGIDNGNSNSNITRVGGYLRYKLQ